MDFEPALRRERETLEIARQVLSGEPVSYDGSLFTIEFESVRFDPSDDVALYLAAQGETNRRLVGEFADGWLPAYIPLSALESARAPVIEGAKARGRDPDDIATVPSLTTCVLSDGDLANDRCRATIAFYIGLMGDYHFRALAENGYREVAERIREASAEGNHDEARAAVSDELLSDVALSGTPEQVEAQLETMPDGIDTLVATPSSVAEPEEVRATVSNLGSLIERH
jgi:alkanesulfonate monooxygenase SsuD/methylene tetrahydromethanopterin reductase-like flavin-dependent oxidoreductase (luciferase family)